VASSGLLYGYDLGVSGFFFFFFIPWNCLSIYLFVDLKKNYSLFHFTLHLTYVHHVWTSNQVISQERAFNNFAIILNEFVIKFQEVLQRWFHFLKNSFQIF
jgi:hypothetical protein